MKTNMTIHCSRAGAALLCAAMAFPAMAQSHGGGGRGSGASAHAGGARAAHGGRYDGRWKRGGLGWWGLGLGFGWGGAYYLGDPYFWPPGDYPQYESPVLIDTPPSGYDVRPNSPVAPNWYYCASARSYYPYVRRCPETWQTVPAGPAGAAN